MKKPSVSLPQQRGAFKSLARKTSTLIDLTGPALCPQLLSELTEKARNTNLKKKKKTG